MADTNVKKIYNMPSGSTLVFRDPGGWSDEGMVNGAYSYHYLGSASSGGIDVVDKAGEILFSQTGLKYCSRVRLIGAVVHLNGNI